MKEYRIMKDPESRKFPYYVEEKHRFLFWTWWEIVEDYEAMVNKSDGVYTYTYCRFASVELAENYIMSLYKPVPPKPMAEEVKRVRLS